MIYSVRLDKPAVIQLLQRSVRNKGENRMKPVKAVIVGVLIDILGSLLAAVLIGFALGIYLLSHGVAKDEMEAVLTARLMHAPWNILGYAAGAAISVIAGYVTAKIAKQSVYLYAGIVGCISGIFGYWTGLDYVSVQLNVALALLAIVSAVFGAFLWLKSTSPHKPADPAD
jgi:hypothetical protein